MATRLTEQALRAFDRQTCERLHGEKRHEPFEHNYLDQHPIDVEDHIASGGPDLSDLRNFPMASRSRISASTSRKNTSVYNGSFEQILLDAGVHGDLDESTTRPDNFAEIQAMLTHGKVKGTQSEFEAFVDGMRKARGEMKAVLSALPLLLGDEKIPNEQDRIFNNLEPIAEGLPSAKPDYYEGSRALDLHKSIRYNLSNVIIPNVQTGTPILPNFFMELKGPDGSATVVRNQCLHAATLGAKGVNRLQAYTKGDDYYDNKSYTLSATFYDGTIRLYVTHPVSHEGSVHFYTSQVDRYVLDRNLYGFTEGVTALRNARLWCLERRRELVDEANRARIPLDSHTTSSSRTAAVVEPPAKKRKRC